MISAWFGGYFPIAFGVLCGIVCFGIFAVMAWGAYKEAKRHTVCHQLAERRSLKPAWEAKPDPLPSDYDFPPPITEMSFVAPQKERTDDDL